MNYDMNNYEKILHKTLQQYFSKRESSEAVLFIREALYGDAFHPIHPMENGEYPDVNELVSAYLTDSLDSVSCYA